MAICPQCNGARRVATGPPLGIADGQQYDTCPTCNGSGTVPDVSTKLSVRESFIAFIKAANEEAIANPIGVPIIRVNQNLQPYPRLEFGSRFSMDRRKVLVWTDDRTHSEMTPEEAVDLFFK